MAELLEESDDDPHVVVVHEVVDVVGRRGGRLVARRDEVAQPDLSAGIQERDADGAALHDGRHPTLRDVVRHRRAPCGGAARKVEEAQAIRPAHRHAVRLGYGRELDLGAHAILTRFAEAAREDDGAARTFEGRGAHGGDHRGLRHGDEHRVDGIAYRVERGVRPPAEEFGPAGRDEVDASRVADALERQPGVEAGADPVGGADYRDRPGAQQPGEAHRSVNVGSRFSVNARGPSAASGCANTSRQISCS